MSSKWFLPLGFPTKILYTTFLSPIHATCNPHCILLDIINQVIFGDEYRSFSSSLYSFPHYPVTSSLLGTNILLNTLFSNNISLRSSWNVSDLDPYTYKTSVENKFQFILIFIFFRNKQEVKNSATNYSKRSLT